MTKCRAFLISQMKFPSYKNWLYPHVDLVGLRFELGKAVGQGFLAVIWREERKVLVLPWFAPAWAGLAAGVIPSIIVGWLRGEVWQTMRRHCFAHEIS